MGVCDSLLRYEGHVVVLDSVVVVVPNPLVCFWPFFVVHVARFSLNA